MQYRQLGKTDLKVSALSLGTVALGMPYGITPKTAQARATNLGLTPPSDNEAIQLVHRALDQGINFIDTARGYGRSEDVLGKALKDRRDQVIIATKLSGCDAAGNPLPRPTLMRQMQESLITSLKRLHTDFVDLLMLHSASVDLLENSDALENLRAFQAQGWARYIGVSTYGAEAPRLAIRQQVDAVQVAYNILDQRMADEIFPLAAAAGVGIVARSVFLKGALTPRADDLPHHLSGLKQRSAAVKQLAAQLRPPMTRMEAALKFVLAQPNIATALVGVRNQAELDASLAVLKGHLLEEDVINQLKQLRWDNPSMLDPSRWGLP